MVLKHEEQEEIKDQASKTLPKPLSKVSVTPRAYSKPAKVIAKLQENQRIITINMIYLKIKVEI